MHKQPTIAEMRAALKASAGSMTPIEHFRRMIRNGLINSKGELTKLVGGDADPEFGAKRPKVATNLSENSERK